ncbi:MAG: hypothetical protein HQ517_14535 [SAR324 cluster bacterium]|nr:hypothetical protein [SAR324 cluster bacterium]
MFLVESGSLYRYVTRAAAADRLAGDKIRKAIKQAHFVSWPEKNSPGSQPEV